MYGFIYFKYFNYSNDYKYSSYSNDYKYYKEIVIIDRVIIIWVSYLFYSYYKFIKIYYKVNRQLFIIKIGKIINNY